jgi:hypothetical protein
LAERLDYKTNASDHGFSDYSDLDLVTFADEVGGNIDIDETAMNVDFAENFNNSIKIPNKVRSEAKQTLSTGAN